MFQLAVRQCHFGCSAAYIAGIPTHVWVATHRAAGEHVFSSAQGRVCADNQR